MDRNSDVTKPGYEPCETCTQKGVQKVAEAFCVQCQDFMCTQCSEYHFLSKLTKHHRILRDKEMPSRKVSTSTAEFCSVHDGESCNFYCQVHNRLICYTCKDISHTKCNTVTSIAELSQCIEKSEKYQYIRVELRHMLQLFRTLKTELLRKFHNTRDYIESTCQGQQTLESGNAEDEENFINSQVECVEKVTDEIKKMTNLLQSCDVEIHLAEKLDTDFNILEQTQQYIQLYVSMNIAEQMIEHMKSVNRDITEQASKDTTANLSIQEPQTVRTAHFKPVIDRYSRPRPEKTYGKNLWLQTCCCYLCLALCISSLVLPLALVCIVTELDTLSE